MPKHIYDLGNDIFPIVLELLSIESSKSLHNVLLSSKRLCILAKKYLYRKLRFTFARCWETRNALLLRRLEQDPDAASFVHEIHINWAAGVVPRKESSTNTGLMFQLTYLIPNLTSLKKLIWDAQCAIPPSLYDKVARYTPSCELITRCPPRNDIARALQLLQDSMQLVALQVMVERTQHQAIVELRKVLVSCFNLKKLHVTYESFPNAPAAGFGGSVSLCAPGMQLPPLSVLNVGEMTVVDYSQDGWEQCVHWEALESLHCTEIQFFPAVVSSLKNLRTLDIHLSKNILRTDEQGDAVLELVKISSNLEKLCLTGMTESLQSRDFLSQRNSSLKYIKIHENQVYGDFGADVRPTLGFEDIEKLGTSYPRLKKCSIDLQVDVSVDWPLETLSRIAESLWFIVELELNLELHLPGIGPPRPVATLQSVLQIWHFLWRKIENHRKSLNHITYRPRLRLLRVLEGSFRQAWDIPRQAMRHERSEQATFEARLSEREDLAEYGYADVVCLELEALRNKYGRGPQDEPAKEELMQSMVERAERGPRMSSVALNTSELQDLVRNLNSPLLAMADM